jgi:hypothetical protein
MYDIRFTAHQISSCVERLFARRKTMNDMTNYMQVESYDNGNEIFDRQIERKVTCDKEASVGAAAGNTFSESENELTKEFYVWCTVA